jgi:hypothetical protein
VMRGKGRHDPCVLPRAVPMVEAMSKAGGGMETSEAGGEAG